MRMALRAAGYWKILAQRFDSVLPVSTKKIQKNFKKCYRYLSERSSLVPDEWKRGGTGKTNGANWRYTMGESRGLAEFMEHYLRTGLP